MQSEVADRSANVRLMSTRSPAPVAPARHLRGTLWLQPVAAHSVCQGKLPTSNKRKHSQKAAAHLS